jgi:hypothetical protein
MNKRQVSDAIRKALDRSPYRDFFVRHGGCYRLFFEYDGHSAQVYSPAPNKACLMVFPDQVKEDTIVVSTDAIRLPQDMDEDSIAEKLIKINSVNKGIRYEMPFLYHAGPDINRAVLVIKEVRSMSEDYVSNHLPAGIEEVLKATAAFVDQS